VPVFLKCEKCGHDNPMPAGAVANPLANSPVMKMFEKLDPAMIGDKMAQMDKAPAQLKAIKNGLALVNEKLNILGDETFHVDLKKHPRVEAVKKQYE